MDCSNCNLDTCYDIIQLDKGYEQDSAIFVSDDSEQNTINVPYSQRSSATNSIIEHVDGTLQLEHYVEHLGCMTGACILDPPEFTTFGHTTQPPDCDVVNNNSDNTEVETEENKAQDEDNSET